MSQRRAATRKAARCRLIETFIGLLLLSAAAAGVPLAAARQQPASQADIGKIITLPLTVCVSDASGSRAAVQPLLLNSPSNKSDVVKQRTADGCYASPPIKLAVGPTYFVAAVAQGQTAVTPFTIAADDKEKSLNLTLAARGGQASADIEICAKDEGGNRLPVTEIAASGDQARLTSKEPAAPDCYRVAAAAANEYRLSLTARGAGRPAAPLNDRLILLGASLLLAATALTLAVLLYIRLRGLTALTDQATAGEVARAHKVLSASMPGIRGEVEAPGARLPPPSPMTRQAEDDQPDGAGPVAAHVPAHDTPPPEPARNATPPPAPAADHAPRQNRSFDDAKLKYRDLSAGQPVEHFYLMPSGSSTASGMVEDSRVELLEQRNGTYVGFRSAVNEGEAMVFPMPKVHFSPDTFKALFPGLTAQDYESGNIEPKVAVNTQPRVWKVQ